MVDQTLWVPPGAFVSEPLPWHRVEVDQHGLEPHIPAVAAPLTARERMEFERHGTIQLAPVLPSTAERQVAYGVVHRLGQAAVERVFAVPDEIAAAFAPTADAA